MGLIPGSGRFSWTRKWQPTPVFLPEKFHWQRSLADYSPWGSQRVRYNWAIEHTRTFISTLLLFGSSTDTQTTHMHIHAHPFSIVFFVPVTFNECPVKSSLKKQMVKVNVKSWRHGEPFTSTRLINWLTTREKVFFGGWKTLSKLFAYVLYTSLFT